MTSLRTKTLKKKRNEISNIALCTDSGIAYQSTILVMTACGAALKNNQHRIR